MKKIKQAAPVLCTLLLLGLGALMPRLASMALDSRLESKVVLRENQNFSFTLEQEVDFFKTLQLFSNAHLMMELDEGYHMKAEEAKNTAVEIRALLSASDGAYKIEQVTPTLLTSKDVPGVSAVFWQCIFTEAFGGKETLWLDDQSGRMVSFSGRVEWYSLSTPNTVSPYSPFAAADYCRLHYPVDTVTLSAENEDNPDGRYRITLLKKQDGQEVEHTISMRLVDGWLYFNA